MKKINLKQVLALCIVSTTVIGIMVGCKSGKGTIGASAKEMSVNDIKKSAQKEGQVVSVGMPDAWADWKDTWKDITDKYGIQHKDTDMSSAEEISKFESEKNKPTADIGDVGMMFAPIAVQKGVTRPYKTSYWKDIPSWAKDKDGNWVIGYQGTIAFITNKKLVKNPPKSWSDILNGNYKVSIGDVTKEAEAQNVVLAAAMGFGGNEKNLTPAFDFFTKLSKQKRLSVNGVTAANLEKGEVEVGIQWDFNALSLRDQIDKNNYEVTIPQDGTVVSGYSTIINKYAPHPNAAKLAREYILSDAGQINLARGYARPIRSDVQLPEDVKSKLLPNDEYKSAKHITDFKAWNEALSTLPQQWQEKVLIYQK